MPTRNGGVRRLIFVNNAKTSYENKYVAGSGIGACCISVRRVLKRKATSRAGTMDNPGGCPCIPAELSYNPCNLAFPNNKKN
jgi:hypothetical protein